MRYLTCAQKGQSARTSFAGARRGGTAAGRRTFQERTLSFFLLTLLRHSFQPFTISTTRKSSSINRYSPNVYVALTLSL